MGLTATTLFTLTCTGDGGSTMANTTVTVVPAPTIAFNAAQTALTANYSTTLSWTAANATECSASNSEGSDFTGARPVFGADATGPVSTATTFTLTCHGIGGTTSVNVQVNVSAPPANQVVLFGRVTFDRLPFNSVAGQGLTPLQPVVSPAREVTVNVIGAGNPTTVTDAGGYYAVTIPVSTAVAVNVRAQMLKTGALPNWNFRVLDNTDSDSLYVLTGDSSVPVENVPRNLHAPSGWGGSGYTGTRAAAPFAILDTVYQTKQLILSAEPMALFPDLNLFWSPTNRSEVNQDGGAVFCPDDGAIITSFYLSGQALDDCTAQGQPIPEGIYVLGDYGNGAGDTDEFDAHVIAHEFGHYFEDRFSRSDSIGGEHGFGDRLDLRVAFGEGWGNAFGAMALNDPVYRDSFNGISQDGGFSLETGNSQDSEGWFSESSVGRILWDIFDTSTESGDNVALGFTPIYDVMTGPQVNTDALTSIFSFISGLRSQNSGSGTAISALLNREEINGDDAFGRNESNSGGDTRALPVYDEIFLNTPKSGVCSGSVAGSKTRITDGIPNKLGNHRFLRFTNDAQRLVTITVQGAAVAAGTVAATDPDIYVFRRGQVVLAGESGVAGSETISMQQLPAGTYVIDVFDYETTGTNQSPRCMTVSITG